jgi:hypothetical protein
MLPYALITGHNEQSKYMLVAGMRAHVWLSVNVGTDKYNKKSTITFYIIIYLNYTYKNKTSTVKLSRY